METARAGSGNHGMAVKGRKRTSGLVALSFFLIVCGAACLPFDSWMANTLQIERVEAVSGDLYRTIQLLEIWGHGTGVLLFIIGMLWIRPDWWRTSLRMAIAWLLAGGIVNLVKASVFRYRPKNFLPEITADEHTWLGVFPMLRNADGPYWNLDYLTQSFPSGHAANAMVLSIWLSWLCPRGKPLFVGLAIIACTQRVLSHAHWPSDVFGGAVVALIAALVSRRIPLPGELAGSPFPMVESRNTA